MKKSLMVFGILLGLSLVPWCAQAQSYWLLKFQGTATSSNTNDPTKLKTTKLSEKYFVQKCATGAGLTNTSKLALVLHLNAENGADHIGDRIEVINTDDPNLFRCDICKLLSFTEGENNSYYTNSTGTFFKQFAYVYLEGDDHSRGSAIITEKIALNKSGETNKVTMEGKMQFWMGTIDDPNPAVCDATFTVKKPLTNLP